VATATSPKRQSRKDSFVKTLNERAMGFLAVAGCMLLAATMSAVLTRQSPKD
jgi:hypothetical protein